MENKFGNFVWNNKTAYLMYGTEGDMYQISHLDDPGEPGHKFLVSLTPGDVIVLRKGNDEIKLTVINLEPGTPYIRCDAKAL